MKEGETGFLLAFVTTQAADRKLPQHRVCARAAAARAYTRCCGFLFPAEELLAFSILPGLRKTKHKGCAVSRFAPDGNGSAESAGDNVVDDGQAEARPLTDRLGGEHDIEDFGQD